MVISFLKNALPEDVKYMSCQNINETLHLINPYPKLHREQNTQQFLKRKAN